MHTYYKDSQGTFRVVFEVAASPPKSSMRPIREFDNEADAARFVSFLNGGERFILF
jgi:hypothetical protein